MSDVKRHEVESEAMWSFHEETGKINGHPYWMGMADGLLEFWIYENEDDDSENTSQRFQADISWYEVPNE